MLEAIGIISAIFMTISSIPQAWSVYKKGSADELSMPTQILWLMGEICYIIYIWPMQNMILIANCIPPLICIFTTMYYKLRPRKKPAPILDTATPPAVSNDYDEELII